LAEYLAGVLCIPAKWRPVGPSLDDPYEKIFFGWVDGSFPEWCYFSLLEMAFIEVKSVPVMWDEDFKPVCFLDLPREDDGG